MLAVCLTMRRWKCTFEDSHYLWVENRVLKLPYVWGQHFDFEHPICLGWTFNDTSLLESALWCLYYISRNSTYCIYACPYTQHHACVCVYMYIYTHIRLRSSSLLGYQISRYPSDPSTKGMRLHDRDPLVNPGGVEWRTWSTHPNMRDQIS